MNSQNHGRDTGGALRLAPLLLALALLVALALPGLSPAHLPTGPAAEALAEAGPHAPPAEPGAPAAHRHAPAAPQAQAARARRPAAGPAVPRHHRQHPPSRAPPTAKRSA